MRVFFHITLLISLGLNLKAQPIDYLDIRDTIVTLGCGKIDIDITFKSTEKLLNMDTSVISHNIHLYYKDIANCYYRIWAETKDINDAYHAIYYNKLVINKNPDFTVAYWDLLYIYYFIGECHNGDDYLQIYKNKIIESEWELDQIKQLKELCKKNNLRVYSK